ncbi:hypothetical protein H5410_035899, partial [Solanum commersonii]
FLKIWVAEDHSAQLVEISTHSAICPLVWFITFLLFPSAFSHFEPLGNIVRLRKTARDSPNCLGDPQEVFSPFFQPLYYFLLDIANRLTEPVTESLWRARSGLPNRLDLNLWQVGDGKGLSEIMSGTQRPRKEVATSSQRKHVQSGGNVSPTLVVPKGQTR